MSLRTFLIVPLAVLAVTAGAATAAQQAPRSVSPGLVHRGQLVTISSHTYTGASNCFAMILFSNGHNIHLSTKHPTLHRVKWVYRVGAAAPLGQWNYQIYCDFRIQTQGTFVVAAAKSAAGEAEPRVVADKDGFSQRPHKYDDGSDLSYGIVLHNLSKTEDAQNVYIIVNMVASNGMLLGSKSTTIKLIPADSTWALGDTFGLRTQAAVASLELTIRVAAHSPKKAHVLPDLANVRLVPSQLDTGYLGEVDGELVNDTSPQTLGFTNISVVVFDQNGVPVGGGTGMNSASIPYGSRFVFLAQSGFNAIPLDKAASVAISLDPSYTAPI